MKRFVVEVEVRGRRHTRLVPARNAHTACKNCTTEESIVISCVPYTGQNVEVSYQGERSREWRYFGESLMEGLRKGAERQQRR